MWPVTFDFPPSGQATMIQMEWGLVPRRWRCTGRLWCWGLKTDSNWSTPLQPSTGHPSRYPFRFVRQLFYLSVCLSIYLSACLSRCVGCWRVWSRSTAGRRTGVEVEIDSQSNSCRSSTNTWSRRRHFWRWGGREKQRKVFNPPPWTDQS